METKHKLVVVGDALLPTEYIVNCFSSLEDAGWDIKSCSFGPPDLGELDQQLALLEKHGPDILPEPEELHELLDKADVLVVHMCPVSSSLLQKYPHLLAVGILRGGTENIDSEGAKQLGIPVFHTRGRTAEAVSDFTIGMILAELRNIARAHHEMVLGRWPKKFPNNGVVPELRELTIGLIGYGEIGQLVTRKLSGFDCDVLVYDPYVPKEVIETSGATSVSLNELLKLSDVISLHARHTAGNPPIIGEKELSLMKEHAYIVNTARAGLIDMEALTSYLQEGRIMGAALDVFDLEPLHEDHPLRKLPNVTLTSHIAFDTAAFYKRSPFLWWDGLDDALFRGNKKSWINKTDTSLERLNKLKKIWRPNVQS